jgi:hypothetical protein
MENALIASTASRYSYGYKAVIRIVLTATLTTIVE